ncbi:hypothetical protein [Pedobacter jejuensis]|uniref:Uncharacterized protein n=1 Tax=Pedobacter jejuensis TaxID=1268550 RepID=A0A3N0BPC8_9SPHI|nr:hypothetical protein [Pedobacter jejuensis]RNL50712.1 hypothetical protein D7004_17620 [Pedobacter jejuensis]
MKNLIIILTVTILSACGQGNGLSKTKTLRDFIDIPAIDKAEVSNNHGRFHLNAKQLNNFKTALKKLSYEPNQDIYMGGKGVTFAINKKEYHLSMRTNGEMAEITIDNQTLVFKTNGLNLDNYEKN